jgi:hypothetical protein
VGEHSVRGATHLTLPIAGAMGPLPLPPQAGRKRAERGNFLPLVEAQGDKAEIALALDQQQDRLPS